MTDQAKALIAQSSLSEAEAEEFLPLLLESDKDGLEAIVALFEEDIAWVSWLYENYRTKKEALLSRDEGALERILEKEKEKLR